VLGVGAAFDDALGRRLRTAGAALGLLACLAVTTGRFSLEGAGAVPPWAVAAYPPLMAAVLAGYGRLLGHRPALAAAAVAAAGWLAALGWRGYCSLRQVIVGLDLIALGLVLLGLAELISLAKGGLLPGPLARGKGRVPHSSA
ncbi:MAG TPA: hypothetical protein VF590_22185, partial [Isosphaeraceae bacterium]